MDLAKYTHIISLNDKLLFFSFDSCSSKFIVDISKVWLDPEEFPGEKIRNIVLPVLIVHADHDDIPVEESVEIYRLIPHSELAVAPNSNHMLPVNNLELYFALISDFLRRYGTFDK